ncbi:MAG: DUF4902 domain-containing protein [Variovorax sp.]|nr:MAG: DUF4902 domain-containing protein [Variovorax sp.]
MHEQMQDGLLRLGLQALQNITLQHLMSGLDDGSVGQHRCGAMTSVSGYTEWIGTQAPCLSLGWDWQLQTVGSEVRVVRIGSPRSNVIVLDDHGRPRPWPDCLAVLAEIVDALDWQSRVLEAIRTRYATDI